MIIALKVSSTVSLSWPQAVLVKASRTWRRLGALAAISETCGVKVNMGSNVTPRILGFLMVVTGMLFIEIGGSAFTTVHRRVPSTFFTC